MATGLSKTISSIWGSRKKRIKQTRQGNGRGTKHGIKQSKKRYKKRYRGQGK